LFFSVFFYVSAPVMAQKVGDIRSNVVPQEYIEMAITEAAQKATVPQELLRAICMTESNLQVQAFVFNDGGDQNHAYGMCQVLRKTSEKYVGKDKGCLRDFRDGSLVRNSRSCKLFGPKLNALSAAMYLKEQVVRYNGHFFKAAAAFNSGSLRRCSDKGWVSNARGERIYRCKPGDLLNRRYVERIKFFIIANNGGEKREVNPHHANFTLNCHYHRSRKIICM
jgi:hypothetical protein